MIYDGLITVAPCSRPSRERETDGRRSIVNFLRLKSENVWCKPQSVPFARVDQRPTTTCHLPVVVCTRDSLAHTHTHTHARSFGRERESRESSRATRATALHRRTHRATWLTTRRRPLVTHGAKRVSWHVRSCCFLSNFSPLLNNCPTVQLIVDKQSTCTRSHKFLTR